MMYKLATFAMVASMLCVKLQLSAMQPGEINELSLEEIESINFEESDISIFRTLFTYAQSLSLDSNDSLSFRGEIILMILSDDFAADLKAKKLTTSDLEVRELIKDFETLKFNVYHPIIPDYVKFGYNLCEGNYGYLYIRIKTRGYFWPVIIVISIFLLWLYGQFSNQFVLIQNTRLKKGLIILAVVAVVFLLFFFNTCSTCISPDMFYGIHL